MDKGIVIVAAQNAMYGRLAYNLAVSIKAIERDMPVTVLHNGRGLSHLNDRQRQMFDTIIELPQETGGVEAKLSIYNHSPYDRTLYIDADNLWFPKRKPSELFAELEGHSFTAITEGRYDIDNGTDELSKVYTVWADIGQLIEAYELTGVFHQFRTEVMYFEKGEQAQNLFSLAVEIYQDPKTTFTEFAAGVPDEFAINIAACKLGIKPHAYKWQPAYWYPLSGRWLPWHELYAKYWILSTGGNGATPAIRLLYDNIVKAASNKLRVQFLFNLHPKRMSIKERQKL